MSEYDFGGGIFAPEWSETVVVQHRTVNAEGKRKINASIPVRAWVVQQNECAANSGDPVSSGWVFLLPPDTGIATGDTIDCRNRTFEVRAVRACRSVAGSVIALRCIAV